MDSGCKIVCRRRGRQALGTLNYGALIKPNLFELETGVNAKRDKEEDILRLATGF